MQQDDSLRPIRPDDISPEVVEGVRREIRAAEEQEGANLEAWLRGEMVDEPRVMAVRRRKEDLVSLRLANDLFVVQDRECLRCKGAFHGSRYYCDACVITLLAEREQHKADYVERERLAREPERLAFANLPSKVRGFPGFEYRREVSGLKAVITAAQAWGGGQGPPVLTIAGGPGMGKSHLAEAALRAAFARGCTVRWEMECELLARLRLVVADGGSPDYELAQVNRAEYLVLDDLGREKGTEWVQGSLFRLVNSRYTHGRRMLITTNEDEKSLAAKLGAGLADRVFDTGTGVVRVVVLDGKSWRAK